jgi:hypothetical protein
MVPRRQTRNWRRNLTAVGSYNVTDLLGNGKAWVMLIALNKIKVFIANMVRGLGDG